MRANYGVGAYNKGRVTLNAINALLADIYLWDQQYEKSIEYCDKLLSKSIAPIWLMAIKLLNSVFTGNSTESIFELQFDKDVQYNNTVSSFYGYNGAPYGQLSFPVYLSKPGIYSPFNYAASAIKKALKT